MAEGLDEGLAWCLGAFHAAVLVALAVALLYALGDLGGLLGGVGTLAGAAAYLALWGLAWHAARATLAGAALGPEGPSLPQRVLLERAAMQGGLAGALVVAAVVLLLFLPTALANAGLAGFLGIVPFLALGAMLAFVVGAAVGVALGLLDAALLAGARALVR